MHQSLRFLLCAPSVLVLGALTGCGGGGGGGSTATPTPPSPPAPVYAKVLTYTNPSSTDFRLVVDPKTNGTAHLVLNLMGTSGGQIQGAAFFLSVDPTQATWSSMGSSAAPYALAGTALNMSLGSQPSVQLFKTRLGNAGADLQVGIFQKTGIAAITDTKTIVSVGLDLGTSVVSGTVVNLTQTRGKSAIYVDRLETTLPMNPANGGSIDIGKLVAQ